MGRFYSYEEMSYMGIRNPGKNVQISRTAIITNPELLSIGNNVRIDDYVLMTGAIWLRSHIHISSFCSLGGRAGIVMENFSGLSAGVRIFSASDDYSGDFMTNPTVPEEYTNVQEGVVHLREHAIVGANSVILPGIEIGKGAAVGAISLITKNVPEFEIWAGIPAKKIADRKRNMLQLGDALLK